jgi:hypothetical protein
MEINKTKPLTNHGRIPMKLKYGIVLLALVLGVILWPVQQARSQDTLVVGWSKDGIYPTIDSLQHFVYGDTTATGARKNLNRVYKLQQGGIYWLANRIENTQNGNVFPLRLVGEAAGPTYIQNPPVIQMVHTATGTNPDSRMITGLTDVTLKNLYLTGRWDDGTQGSNYQWITMTANNSRFIIDDCILEQSNFAPIAFTGTGNEIFYTNNKFRNLVERPITQQWTGRGSSIWADQDTVIFENNTFFDVACFAIQIEGGSAKYVRFNHNTIVDNGRQVAQGNWWQNAYIANNLIVNGFWEGEGHADLTSTGRDPRQTYNGLFTIGPLPSMYGPEEGRRIVIAKNYAYLDPRFTALYATDGVQRAWFVDPITILDYLNVYNVGGAADGHMYCRDTVWLANYPAGMMDPLNDPDWLKPRYNVTGATMIDSMWGAIRMIRNNLTASGEQYQFAYKQNTGWTDYTWPLPEHFEYTDANLVGKGTDGLNIGDLNWFPTQKATFEANKANFVAQIEALAGQVVVFTVDTSAEAEFGELGGTAAVEKFSGFSYFDMASGGYIQWDFNLTTGGVYGMNVWSNLRGQGMRGEHFFINGNEIHDVIGWGELEFMSSTNHQDWMPARGVGIGIPDTTWQWYFYPKDSILAAEQPNFVFVAGHNTIKITPSWGYQDFAGIDLIKDGVTPPLGGTATGSDVVIALRAPDASTSIVTPKGEGAPWIPSLFKSVKMGTGGTVALTMTAPEAGTYRLRIFGQNYTASPQMITVKEGSTTLVTPSMPKVKTDTTGLDVVSAGFPLTAGDHTLVFSAANINIDYVQLIKETVSAVKQISNLPEAFSLAQNYPNPFNPTTTINFSLGKASNVTLTVYNILGQKVATLLNSQHMDVGAYAVQFDARNLASGVYFYRLQAGDFRSDKKMLLLK